MGGISEENGRVVVNGALAVMEINGILTKNIFDWNKHKHEFYIEESYPIQWMYPYLRPFGVIMKIEPEPLPAPTRDAGGNLTGLWKEIVDLDTAYWDKLTADFLAREEFRRNPDAQKSFSKLRSSIAGVYLQRNMIAEAQYAYRQAIELCPEGGSEGGWQLVEIMIRQRKFADAMEIADKYLERDPHNAGMADRARRIKRIYDLDAEILPALKSKIDDAGQPTTIKDIMDFVSGSLEIGMLADARNYGNLVTTNESVNTAAVFAMGQIYSRHNRHDMAATAFQRYLARQADDANGWVELGWALVNVNRFEDAYKAWENALKLGGRDTALQIVNDVRIRPFLLQQPYDGPFRTLLREAGSPPRPQQPSLPLGPRR